MAWEMPGLLGKPLVVDCHSHLIPPNWYLDSTPRSTVDLDALFFQQDDAGVNLTVFGNNWIRTPPAGTRLDAVKEFNAFAAEVTASIPSASWAWPRRSPMRATRFCKNWSARSRVTASKAS